MRGDVVSNELLIHVFLYPWKGLEVDSERLRMRAHTSNEQSSTAENGAYSLRIFPHQHLFEKKTFVGDGISGFLAPCAGPKQAFAVLGTPTRVPRDIR
jgi:hypothetical protein